MRCGIGSVIDLPGQRTSTNRSCCCAGAPRDFPTGSSEAGPRTSRRHRPRRRNCCSGEKATSRGSALKWSPDNAAASRATLRIPRGSSKWVRKGVPQTREPRLGRPGLGVVSERAHWGVRDVDYDAPSMTSPRLMVSPLPSNRAFHKKSVVC